MSLTPSDPAEAPGEIVRALERALSGVVNPANGEDIVSGGRVRDMVVDAEGRATFRFALQAGDPGALVREAREAARRVEGVRDVKVDVRLPSPPGRGGGAPAAPSADGPAPAAALGSRGHAPRQGPAPASGLQPGSVPAPTPKPGLLAEVGRIVAVSSGKGGVGKSMVASNLAALAASRGLATGLLDADIYGPNIPTMFGEARKPAVTGAKGAERIVPVEAHGVRLMSLGLLLEPEQPAIMRGPLIAGVLKQFMEQVAWGRLDLMIVDMPPGTGDAQLSLVQTVDLDGALMVTTPQKVATGDVRRGVRMFERVNTRILGIVENMRGFEIPESGEVVDLFGRGGGEELARDLSVPFLGAVPLDVEVRRSGDLGHPTVLSAPGSNAGRALAAIGDNLLRSLERLPPRDQGKG